MTVKSISAVALFLTILVAVGYPAETNNVEQQIRPAGIIKGLR